MVVLTVFLKKIPDTPGYTAVNRNSLLDWSNKEEAHDTVVLMRAHLYNISNVC